MSTQEERFAQIAAAIREKDGTTGPIKALDFAARIRAIPIGSGASDFAIPLVVTVDAGAAVTATHGETTVTATSGADGTAALILTAPGIWRVTAALGDKEKSTEIEVIDGYTAEFMLSSRLPVGYTELEYIHSDGKSGINTGFNTNFASTRHVLDIEADNYVSGVSGNNYIITMTGVASRYYCFLSRPSQNKIRYRYYTNAYQEKYEDITGKRLIIDWNFPEGKLHVGASSFITNPVNYTMGTFTHFFVMEQGDGGIPAKMYSAQIYTNGTIQRDFVPCIDPFGAVGLFDLVEEKFYPNAGTGTFTPGPAV